MYNKSLTQRIDILGNTTHPSIAYSYNKLGNVYLKQRNYMAAKNMYDQALQQRLAIFADNMIIHPDMADSYYSLADFYLNQKEYGKAEEMCKISLEQRIKIYENKSHPSIADCYRNLSKINNAKDHFKEALDLLHKSLEIYMHIFEGNKSHPLVKECNDDLLSYSNDLKVKNME